MPIIPYQETVFSFGALETDVGEREAQPANLVDALNVRLVQRKQYRKREGFSRTLPGTSSPGGNAFITRTDTTGLVPGLNGTMCTIDGVGRAWSYDPTTVTWRERGLLPRPFPQHTASISAAKLNRPVVVIAGTNKWTFAVGTDAYYYVVENTSTGVVLQPPTKVTATGIVNLSAAYDGTNVWVVLVDTSTSATSNKYVNSTPTVAAVSATYLTLAGTQWRNVDLAYLTGPAVVAVVLASYKTSTSDRHTSQSYMNPATGAASGAPAAVNITKASGANNQLVESCPSILVDPTGGGTNWYFVIWEDINSVGNMGLVLHKITTATLATAATTTVVSKANTTNTTAIGACCGYVAANGDQVIYEHSDRLEAEPAPWDAMGLITKRVRGSVTTDTVWARGQWLASKPVLLSGTQWYVMTGFEDDGITLATSVQARGVQRTYNLRDASDGSLVGQALEGEAGGLWHNTITPGAATLGAQYPAQVPAATLVSGKLVTPAMMAAGSLLDLSAGSIVWDFAPTYGLPVRCLDRCLVPGGIPTIFSHQENVREVTPLNGPSYITTSAGATTYTIAATYRFTSPDGTFWRSFPIIGSLSIANGATITIPTLRNLLPNTKAVIEWYAGASGVAYLQEVKDNDPTADSITFTFTNAASLVTNEPLYTTGGALDNAPLPPCKHVAVFQSRAILAGTPEPNAIWVSQEFSLGAGLQFNEALNSEWIKGSGDITALADGGLYMSVHRKDATAVISGPGPDGNADGVFIPQTLDIKENLTNFRSILPAEKGIYFQATDGLIYQLQGTTVVSVYAGMQGLSAIYGSLTVTTCVLNAAAGQAWFLTAGGTILVLDYWHPTPDQPGGQWFVWFTNSMLTTVNGGACVDSLGTVWWAGDGQDIHSQTPGQWQDIGASTNTILMRLKTSALAPWGMLHSGRVESVAFLGRYKGACVMRIYPQVAPGNGSFHDVAIPNTEQLKLRAYPPALNRIGEVAVQVEELSNAGATEGFIFDGLAIRFQDYGIMPPSATERI